MAASLQHLQLRGFRSARSRLAAAEGATLERSFESHRNLRGPLGAAGEVLRRIVPELLHVGPLPPSFAPLLLTAAPDLEPRVGPLPRPSAPFVMGERVRFF